MSPEKQTFADQLKIAKLASKYSKKRLVSELIETDRILREDAIQIHKLGEEIKRLKGGDK